MLMSWSLWLPGSLWLLQVAQLLPPPECWLFRPTAASLWFGGDVAWLDLSRLLGKLGGEFRPDADIAWEFDSRLRFGSRNSCPVHLCRGNIWPPSPSVPTNLPMLGVDLFSRAWTRGRCLPGQSFPVSRSCSIIGNGLACEWAGYSGFTSTSGSWSVASSERFSRCRLRDLTFD